MEEHRLSFAPARLSPSSDETAGRALYRALANALAKAQMNLANRKVLLMTGHTPIPWKRNNKVGYVFGPDCVVARCGDFSDKTPHLVEMNGDRWNADADFIVEAVNSIDALRAENARLRNELIRILDFQILLAERALRCPHSMNSPHPSPRKSS